MRAGCQLRHVSQYRYLNPGDIRTIPLPTSDMFAGGSYEDDTMPVQETTIVPYKASSIAEATEILCKVYKKLPEVIREFQGGPPSGDRRHVGVYGPQHRFHGLPGYPL